MECPKCRHENSEAAQFCLRCHAPLRYVCPGCKHVQQHGGQCEQCGLDFLKYAMVMQSQMQLQADQERQRLKSRTTILKQVLLLPITGGLSLFGYLRSRLRGR